MNIVICCDGTGQEFGPKNTNVVKLYSILDKSQQKQTTFYHPGLGTLGYIGPFSWLASKFKSLFGLAIGYGIRQDVADCYKFLMDNYTGPQDKVFIFGFSRGAYTVRVLSSLIHEFGLLNKGNELLINYAYKMFNRPTSEKFDLANKFKKTFSRVCKPHFVGLWDTVSSVGWVYDPTSFPYTYKNPDIKIGRHAISIDERRCFFRQNLWAPQGPGQSILQVWFPGCHSDVGGGFPYKECGLSQNTLRWMIGHATKAGLVVDRQKEADLYKKPNAKPSADGMIHNSLTWAWWILEFFPKKYYDSRTREARFKIPLGESRVMPEGSLIHRSAIARRKNAKNDYHPQNFPKNYTVAD